MCIKFESGLRPKIMQFIEYQEIHLFPVLVNKCRIYNEYNHVRSDHYKSFSDRNNGNHNRGKPYWFQMLKVNVSFNRKIMVGKVKVGKGFYFYLVFQM